MNDDTDAVTFSGHFSITPRLKATDSMMLSLYMRELALQTTTCPWRVAGCGSVVIARPQHGRASDDRAVRV
jgi:hypothetical protein